MIEPSGYNLLVVDDIEDNRDLLKRLVKRQGHDVEVAANGQRALEKLESGKIDLVLLDIMMPVMDGYEVLRRMKADTALRHTPIIVISAAQEEAALVKCIEMGAGDFLPKPFNHVILRARISACLAKKRLRDQEMMYRGQIETQKKRADDLLHALFPHHVVQELKTEDSFRPRRYQNVAVLFCDIVGFTSYCDQHTPEDVVALLQGLIESFEDIAAGHDLAKIKTIGDSFMAAAGIFNPVENPVLNSIKCGLDMIESAKKLPPHWNLRVGIHLGPVVGGIVGRKQYSFDVWGDTVNTASRVESNGQPDSVNVSCAAWEQVAHLCRGESFQIEAKGKGAIEVIRFKELL